MKDPMVRLDEGFRLLENGAYGKAASYFRGCARDKSLRPSERSLAQLGEARALISIGRANAAQELLDVLEQGDARQQPEDIMPSILHERARLAALTGNREEAIICFRNELVELVSTMPRYYLRLSYNYVGQAEQFLALNDRTQTGIYLKLARDYAETVESEAALREILSLESLYLEQEGDVKEALARSMKARSLFIKAGRKADVKSEEKRIAELTKQIASLEQEESQEDG
jgi:tetratricopeptide (TPR) repeat protein